MPCTLLCWRMFCWVHAAALVSGIMIQGLLPNTCLALQPQFPTSMVFPIQWFPDWCISATSVFMSVLLRTIPTVTSQTQRSPPKVGLYCKEFQTIRESKKKSRQVSYSPISFVESSFLFTIRILPTIPSFEQIPRRTCYCGCLLGDYGSSLRDLAAEI